MNLSKSPGALRPRKNVGASRDAEATRQRILEAAKVHFSQNSFEGIGVRDIARDAHVDAALVIRYFGSKEGLFREIASQAFGTEDFLQEGVAGMPEKIAALLLGDIDGDAWRTGYNPLRLLLCSIGSPVAGPILSEYLDRDFVQPFADALPQKDARERGMAIAAQILGFALIRIALMEQENKNVKTRNLATLLVGALKDITSA
jgi:AcrR family transcriptional regulator